MLSGMRMNNMMNTAKTGKTIESALIVTALAVAVIAANTAVAADAAPAPRTPTPRMANGTVDLGGDGVWNLPYTTNFAATMDGFKEGKRPPFRPWAKAMWEYNRSNDVKYDPEGFCLPPGGPRSMGRTQRK
jgi:hypothetical protein